MRISRCKRRGYPSPHFTHITPPLPVHCPHLQFRPPPAPGLSSFSSTSFSLPISAIANQNFHKPNSYTTNICISFTRTFYSNFNKDYSVFIIIIFIKFETELQSRKGTNIQFFRININNKMRIQFGSLSRGFFFSVVAVESISSLFALFAACLLAIFSVCWA